MLQGRWVRLCTRPPAIAPASVLMVELVVECIECVVSAATIASGTASAPAVCLPAHFSHGR